MHGQRCQNLLSLWTLLAGSTSDDPLVRWGLIRPNSSAFNYIACTFSGYHAIRNVFRSQNMFFNDNQNILTGPQLRVAWNVFADTFFVEARELASPCRKFSFASFLRYLSENATIETGDRASLLPVTGTEVVRVESPLVRDASWPTDPTWISTAIYMVHRCTYLYTWCMVCM